MTFKLSDVEEEIFRQISLLAKEDFSNYWKHAMKEAQKYIHNNSSDAVKNGRWFNSNLTLKLIHMPKDSLFVVAGFIVKRKLEC